MDADKQTMILDAAFDAFIRHGFRRVTMGEIARAAGMSRPALYLEFANKEDIFTAVLRRYSDDLLSEIQAGLKARNTPVDQLMFVCDIWVVRPFEMVQQAPDAQELTDAGHAFASGLIAQVHQRLERIVAEIVTNAGSPSASAMPSAASIAHVMVTAIHGFKDHAQDLADLKRLCADLVSLIAGPGSR